MANRPKTFVPEPPTMVVMPKATQAVNQNNQGLSMQEVMRMMTEQMFQDITGATKKAKEPNKVHPSYTHRDNRWWSEEEAGLTMDDRYVENAPYLPGFYLVVPGDPLALFKVRDFWYTPADGEKSLEIYVNSIEKEKAEKDPYQTIYDIQPSVPPLIQRLGAKAKVPPMYEWEDKQV